MTSCLLKLTLLLCTLTSSLGVKAQLSLTVKPGNESSFKGQLVDSLTKEPLSAAVISVLSQSEFTGAKYVRNYLSDEKGNFSFACYASPHNRMEVTMLGYKPHIRTLVKDEDDRDLGQILLSHSTQAIDDVVVKARLQMYKMKGDTLIYMPRAVNTMKDDVALEILRQMPGVEVSEDGGIKILGQQVERTYVNQKLLFGDDPKTALKELEAEEVASIEAYDEVDEADAVANGESARKRKVLNVVTFKEFSQSYSGNARAEMGADFHKNAEEERSLRYLASGNVKFFSEQLQLTASGGSNNLTAQDGRPSTMLAQRKSFANANVSGRSNNKLHAYKANYSYAGGFSQRRSSSSVDYLPTDYFTSQHSQAERRNESESDQHSFLGDYNYTTERLRLATSLQFSLSNGRNFEESTSRIVRDGKALSATEMLAKDRSAVRNLNWQASGDRRFKGGNSFNLSASAVLSGGQTRGDRYERRETDGVVTPLAWETYIPKPNKIVTGNLGYTFNFNKSGNLTFGTRAGYSERDMRQLYTDLETGVLDVVRSDDAVDKTTTLETGAAYRFTRGGHSLSAGLDYVLENRRYDDAKFDRSDRRNYHFAVGNINYNLRRPKNSLRISLSNRYRTVSSTYLSSRIDDANPLYVSTGSRSLQPEMTYFLNVNSEFMGKTASYVLSAKLDAVTDPVVYRRRFFKEATHLPEYDNYLMPAGSTLTTPFNGASYLRFALSANYRTRIAPLHLFLDMGVGYNLANPEEELYDKKGRELQQGVDFSASITTNFSKKFRITLNNRAGLVFVKRFEVATRDLRNELTGTIEWDIISSLHLRADYTGVVVVVGTGDIPTPAVNLLNVSLGYRVLKERGRISINAYDLLNDYSPIRIRQTVEAISRNVTYVGANYFTISFDYKFNNRKMTN